MGMGIDYTLVKYVLGLFEGATHYASAEAWL
jgi:hypothetical protein